MAFKIVMDGFDDDDEVFDTAQEARDYGDAQVSSYNAGGEILNLSNPGDYPMENDNIDFEVIEVDG